jgi:hypothetical protein
MPSRVSFVAFWNLVTLTLVLLLKTPSAFSR